MKILKKQLCVLLVLLIIFEMILPQSTILPSYATGTTSSSGQGLKGEYYSGTNFQNLVLTRTDPGVNFYWDTGSPDATVPSDNFSVRWTGQIRPEVSGNYSFMTCSDDGVRLTVNGKTIIDNWTVHSEHDDYGSEELYLIAGQSYDITMEYYENGGGAVAELYWKIPNTTTYEIIPQGVLYNDSRGQTGTGLKGEYYTGINFEGLALTRVDSCVEFDWGLDSPDTTLLSDNFTVRWTGQIKPEVSGDYVFKTTTDDDVRLCIDGKAIIDSWLGQSAGDQYATLYLAAGQTYDIVMEYRELGGYANARLYWLPPNATAYEIIPQRVLYPVSCGQTGTGLKGEYYSDMTLNSLAYTRVDTIIDFDWGDGSPNTLDIANHNCALSSDRFSVRWTGQIRPDKTGNYIFKTYSDDGVRLTVQGDNGTTAQINDWTDHGSTYRETAAISLTAGQKYDITLEYYENTGGAVMQLSWIVPGSQTLEVIPQRVLYNNYQGQASEDLELSPISDIGNVGNDGSALYSYAMDDVSLVYNSHAGWGIGNVSSISRSTKNGVPSYTANDTFLWDGQELVLTSSASGIYEYRTKKESFSKIIFDSNQNKWTIYTKGMKVIEYGLAVKTTNDSTKTWKWMRTIEKTGLNFQNINSNNQVFNYTAYLYDVDTDYGECYLRKIITGKGSANQVITGLETPKANLKTISLNYENSNGDYSIRTGSIVKTERRLQEVVVYTHTHYWKFAGLDDGNKVPSTDDGNRSLSWWIDYNGDSDKFISRIMEFSNDEENFLPPTTFTYDTAGSQIQTTDSYGFSIHDGGEKDCKIGDFNSDGKDDYLYFPSAANDYKIISFSNGDGTFSRSNVNFTSDSSIATLYTDLKDSNIVLGDYNGDGKMDFISQPKETNKSFRVYFSNGDGSFNIVTPGYTDLALNPGCNIIPADFNRDGKTDFIRQEKGGWSSDSSETFKVYFSNGDGYFNIKMPSGSSYQTSLKADAGCIIIPGDFNGDGYTDFIRQEGGEWAEEDEDLTFQIYFNKGAGTFADGTFNIVTPTGSQYQDWLKSGVGCLIIPGDFNGDGCTDFIREESGGWDDDTESSFSVYFSKGAGTLADGSFNIVTPTGDIYQNNLRYDPGSNIIPGDFNGDGMTDFIRHSRGNWGNNDSNLIQIYYSTGKGYFNVIDTQGTEYTANSKGSLAKILVGEFNSDGKADFIRAKLENNSATTNKCFCSGGRPLLKTIKTSLGAEFEYTYKLTDRSDDNPDLFFSMPVVASTRVRDNDDEVYTSYDFYNGAYDYTEKQFLGFGRMDVTTSLGNSTAAGDKYSMYFYTDLQKTGLMSSKDIYDSNGHLFGRTQYDYTTVNGTAGSGNSWNKLVESREISFSDDQTTAKQITTSYTFDDWGNVLTITRPIYNKAVNSNQNICTTYTYYNNDNNWIIGLKTSESVSAPSEMASTPCVQQYTRYLYDGNTAWDSQNIWYGFMTQKQMKETPASSNSEFITVEGYEYDYVNSCFYKELANISDQNNNGVNENYCTVVNYDSDYNMLPASMINPKGQTVTISYNDMNLKDCVSDLDNNLMMHYEYDSFLRLEYEYKNNRHLNGEAPDKIYKYRLYDYNGDTSDYTYMKESVLIERGSSSVGNNYLDTYTYYDGFGRVIQTKTETEDASKFRTVDEWHILRSGTSNIASVSADNGEKRSVPYLTDTAEFTSRDNTQPYTFTVSCITCDEGLVTKTVSPDKTVIYREIDEYNTENDYLNGKHVKAINRNDNGYIDSEYSNFVTGGRALSAARYYYDLGTNNLRKAEFLDQNMQVVKTNTVDYDGLNRKLSISDPDLGTWSYTYDENGNIKTKQDQKGQKLSFVYDELNRMVAKNYLNSSETIVNTISYNYDENSSVYGKSIGQLTSVTYNGNKDEYIYHPESNQMTVKRTLDGMERQLTYTFNRAGQISNIQYPDSENVTTEYNNGGQFESLTNGTTNYITDVNYLASGQVSNICYGNNLNTQYDYYDSTGEGLSYNLKEISVQTAGGNIKNKLQYYYDDKNQIKSIKNDKLLPYSQSFAYDSKYRLKQAMGGYGNIVYNYNYSDDKIDSIITNGVAKDYQYSDAASPRRVTDDGESSYTYDSNGNTLTKTTGSTTLTYNYDYDNNLTGINGDGQDIFTADYDPDGQRVKKTENGVTTYYFFPEYEETYKNGTLSDKFNYYFANGQRVAMKDNNNVISYFHQDHLNSTIMMTNAAGDIVERLEYKPYGELDYHEGRYHTEILYTGQRYDNMSSMYYYNARYYNPALSSFNTPDTVMDGVSRYAYCGNNPVMFNDPTGHLSFWAKLAIGIAVAVVVVAAVVAAIPSGGSSLVGAAAFIQAGAAAAGAFISANAAVIASAAAIATLAAVSYGMATSQPITQSDRPSKPSSRNPAWTQGSGSGSGSGSSRQPIRIGGGAGGAGAGGGAGAPPPPVPPAGGAAAAPAAPPLQGLISPDRANINSLVNNIIGNFPNTQALGQANQLYNNHMTNFNTLGALRSLADMRNAVLGINNIHANQVGIDLINAINRDREWITRWRLVQIRLGQRGVYEPGISENILKFL